MPFDVQQFPERTAVDHALQFPHRRPEALVLADAERNARARARPDRALGIRAGERERFFAEHMFAGLQRADAPLAMQPVVKCVYDDIDFGIGE